MARARLPLLVLAFLALSGCSGRSDHDGNGVDNASDGIGSASTGRSGETAERAAGAPSVATYGRTYINGTLNSAWACPAMPPMPLPQYLDSDLQPVPPEAVGRPFEGPNVSSGTNVGAACVAWLDINQHVLPADGDKVPDGAALVVVMGTLQVDAAYSIVID